MLHYCCCGCNLVKEVAPRLQRSSSYWITGGVKSNYLASLLIGIHVALRSESGCSLQRPAPKCVALPRRELCWRSVGMDLLDRLV